MKPIVIHHSGDFDGIFCREIAKKFLPPETEFVGWDFSDPPVKPTRDFSEVYILDLPCDKPLGIEVNRIWPGCSNLIWIDHHKSAIESHAKEICGYRIDGVAACRLTWQWFAGEPPNFANRGGDQRTLPSKEDFVERRVSEPLAVRLAGEYDIWDKRDPRVDIFQYGLRSRELTSEDWKWLLAPHEKPSIEEIEAMIDAGHKQDLLEPDGTVIPAIVHQLLDAGSLLQTYQQRNDAGMMHRSFIVEWEGLKFLALTAARCNSLTFASKDVPETGHDALMGFFYNGKVWTVSLYHAAHRKDIDLSKIAVKHGGGGHRGACGFSIKKLPFV